MPRKTLVLPGIEGYVILKCSICGDQFYVPKKKNETQEDVARWYLQFTRCACCAQVKKGAMVMHPPLNKNWNPADWDPATHDARLLKP